MFGTVKIGDAEVRMLATAATDIYYKRVFRKDPLKIMTSEEWDDAAATEVFMGMGFIMSKQAELKERKKLQELTEDDYIDWLDTMDRSDYVDALDVVMDIYSGNKKRDTEPKKEEDR